MCGNFGYELDLTKLTDEEKAQTKAQVAFYKEVRELIQFGDFYRIKSPFAGNEVAWSFVAKDKSEAIVSFFRVLAVPNDNFATVYAVGLDENAMYKDMRTGKLYGGDELMYVGINVPDKVNGEEPEIGKELFAGMLSPVIEGDYASFIWHFQKVND